MSEVHERPLVAHRITPEVFGVIWATKERLSDTPSPFMELDYLVDGLLTRYQAQLQQGSEKTTKNFFISQNFGHPFFLGHLQYSEDWEKDLKQIMSLVKSLHSEVNKIVILNPFDNKVTQFLKKKYATYDIEKLSF